MNDFMFEEDQKVYDDCIKYINAGDVKNAIEQVDKLTEQLLAFQDALINQYEDYEDEKHLCTRQAYFDSGFGQIRYGYCLYEWNGEYFNNTKLPDLKQKKWREIFHCTNSEKQEMNQKFIDETLKLLDLLHEREKKNNK